MKKLLIVTIMFLVLSASTIHAQVKKQLIGATETGITIEISNQARKSVIESLIFSSYAVTTTKIYNNTGGVATTSGWINIAEYNDNIIFHVDLDTLGSTNVIFTVEALLTDDLSSPMTLFTKTFTAVDTDYSLPICEHGLKFIRCSAIATGAGTNSISVKFRAEGLR